MKKKICAPALTLLIYLILTNTCFAENPIVQTNFTADPAPMVYNDTFWVYTGHDEDGSTVWFNMKEWRCYSSVDMANWTDHGVPMDLTAFSWANADAWAGQCIPRNGNFYFTVPVFHSGTKDRMIGISVANNPAGPFKDALGKPLLSRNDCCYIDPAFFIDDDDQAYMYWGNPYCFYVKMNDNMISYSGDIVQIPENAQTFANCYGEGPWIYKRNNLYYMIWAADNPNGKENIRYSTAPSATGPWTYKGVIMPTQGVSWVKPCTSWTNHPGIVDYKGNSYFVYHNASLPGGSGFQRSTCIEQFEFNADGTIPQINMTLEGPPQIGHLNPYDTTQAETICWASGVKTEKCSEGGMNVGHIENGDYIKVKGVDFGTEGAELFEARVASANGSGNIEVHLDTITGPLVGTCAVSGTGSWQTWITESCRISHAIGVHDVYFKFTGGSEYLFNFNWWKFTGAATGRNRDYTKRLQSSINSRMTVNNQGKGNICIEFPQLVSNAKLSVSLYGLNGQLLMNLFQGRVSSRQIMLLLDRTVIKSGVYIVRATLDNKVISVSVNLAD